MATLSKPVRVTYRLQSSFKPQQKCRLSKQLGTKTILYIYRNGGVKTTLKITAQKKWKKADAALLISSNTNIALSEPKILVLRFSTSYLHFQPSNSLTNFWGRGTLKVGSLIALTYGTELIGLIRGCPLIFALVPHFFGLPAPLVRTSLVKMRCRWYGRGTIFCQRHFARFFNPGSEEVSQSAVFQQQLVSPFL